MTLKDALYNLFIDLDSYQVIHLVTSKIKGNESITYSIGVAMINSKIIFRIESDEYIAVKTYQTDTVEKAKKKLTWLLNKYALTIKSIIYMITMQIFELIVFCYKENLLTHIIETNRINRKEMLISYSIKSDFIDYKCFTNDFNSIWELLEAPSKMFDFEIVFKQEHPLKMVRRLKLESIDVN